MKVSIVNHSPHALPKYQSAAAAGMDLIAWLKAPIRFAPLDRHKVPTGLHIALPRGYEAQVRTRSGLAWKRGLVVLNGVGTIDADYRGEIMVLLINLGQAPVDLCDGERVAQLIVASHERVVWAEAASLSATTRGEGGFGSTGF